MKDIKHSKNINLNVNLILKCNFWQIVVQWKMSNIIIYIIKHSPQVLSKMHS